MFEACPKENQESRAKPFDPFGIHLEFGACLLEFEEVPVDLTRLK
jgi:hypothetical protein